MYKVFFNDRVVLLGDMPQSVFNNHDVLTITPNNKNSVHKALDSFFSEGSNSNLCLSHDNFDQLWEWFRKFFIEINAAGGLVTNLDNSLLCIYRNGRWDLPKGKVEKGESFSGAALREVEEECGISKPGLKDHAINTYHIYPHPSKKGRFVLKQTQWFFMDYEGKDALKPQVEEGIEKVIWLDRKEIDVVFSNTFASLVPAFDLWLNSLKH